MTTTTSSAYTRALGARLLSEANDLKRTAEALASEMGLPLDYLESAIAGALQPDEYRSLFQAVAARYPIAFGRLWMEPGDTQAGVLHLTVEDACASSRIFSRKDRAGNLTPYYEYRDSAMSRSAPFRPEWIRELRVVGDADPGNPDVAYNKGHFLHQTTFFVGPVNFYWEVGGRKRGAELTTGDSNYITPFWPHSFTSRDPDQLALIIAVTYGGEVARGREELARLGAASLPALTLEMRNEAAAHAALLNRHLVNEAMPRARFVDRCVLAGLAAERVEALLDGRALPANGETAAMAEVLAVTPRDLLAPTRRADEEVIILRHADAEVYPYPGPQNQAYEITRLARSRQQPYLKSFILRTLPGRRGAELTVLLHQFLYNFGGEPVRLTARHRDAEREIVLAPGDSAYVLPLTVCRFDAMSDRSGEIYMVGVQGDLHADAVFELSGMAPSGLNRVAGETTRWF
jgi:methylphosphonate synthase